MTIQRGQRAELTSVNKDHVVTTGARIKVHPDNDAFIRSARYGTVTKVGRKYVHIYSETFQRTVRVLLSDCEVI
jgi:hypothetical protein